MSRKTGSADQAATMEAASDMADAGRIKQMRMVAGLTVPEIAKLTGEPLTTVEGRVYRALRKLRAELEG